VLPPAVAARRSRVGYHPTNAVYVRDGGPYFVVLEIADSNPALLPFYVGVFPKR
jgi:hypothetical protein